MLEFDLQTLKKNLWNCVYDCDFFSSRSNEWTKNPSTIRVFNETVSLTDENGINKWTVASESFRKIEEFTESGDILHGIGCELFNFEKLQRLGFRIMYFSSDPNRIILEMIVNSSNVFRFNCENNYEKILLFDQEIEDVEFVSLFHKRFENNKLVAGPTEAIREIKLLKENSFFYASIYNMEDHDKCLLNPKPMKLIREDGKSKFFRGFGRSYVEDYSDYGMEVFYRDDNDIYQINLILFDRNVKIEYHE